MLALILFLILAWVVLGLIGFVVEGLFWLFLSRACYSCSRSSSAGGARIHAANGPGDSRLVDRHQHRPRQRVREELHS
jgi:uncharacterized membrane protein